MALVASHGKLARTESPKDGKVANAKSKEVLVICSFLLPKVPGGGRELPWLLIKDGVSAAWMACKKLNETRQGCSSLLCWGRVWSKGDGGQCSAARPRGGQVCAGHAKNKKHGLVIDVPPENPFRLQQRSGRVIKAGLPAAPLTLDLSLCDAELAERYGLKRLSAPLSRSRSKEDEEEGDADNDGGIEDASLQDDAAPHAVAEVLVQADEGDDGDVRDYEGDVEADVEEDGEVAGIEGDAACEDEGAATGDSREPNWASSDGNKEENEDEDEAELEGDVAYDPAHDERRSRRGEEEEADGMDGTTARHLAEEADDVMEAAHDDYQEANEPVTDDGALGRDSEDAADDLWAAAFDSAAVAPQRRRRGAAARAKTARSVPPSCIAKKERAPSKSAAMEGYLQAARAAPPAVNSKEMQLLSEYVVFTEELLESRELHTLVSTPCGDVSQEEGALRAFLVKLRFGGGPADGPYVLKAKTVENRLVLLKKALRECVHEAGKLPAWAISGCRTSRSLDKLFQQWRKSETQMEAAAQKRGYITDDMVESYCLDLMVKDRIEGRILMEDVFAGLLLRLQSSRSIRHGNLASLRWSDVSWPVTADGRSTLAAIDVIVTKVIGNMSVKRAVTSKLKSRLLAADAVSDWFFRRWCEDAEADRRRPEDFFFPYLKSNGMYDFGAGMNNAQHSSITRAAAAHLKLVTTEEELAGYASTSVRRGCAADLGARLEAVVEDSNKNSGRGKKSRMDLEVYMPDEAVLRPGPLYDDAEGIEHRLRERMADALGTKNEDVLCGVCGYPCCECLRCESIRRGQKSSKSSHSCWLAGRLGRVPKGGFVEDEEQLNVRAAAWAERGVAHDEVPVFHGGFYAWRTQDEAE